MGKLLEFLQGSSGELSSKRLGYLSTVPVVLGGTVWICNKLIATGNAALAVDVWNYFFVFSAVLGGFVSAELFIEVIHAIKGKTIITGKEEPKKTDENSL